jgi:hypothetical protein
MSTTSDDKSPQSKDVIKKMTIEGTASPMNQRDATNSQRTNQTRECVQYLPMERITRLTHMVKNGVSCPWDSPIAK